MKNFLFSLGLILALFSCDSGTTENITKDTGLTSKSGGEIVIPLDSYFFVEKPTDIQKVEGAQINGQIFESLVKYDSKTLEIKPAVAEKWDISEDGLIYTFHIREGVKFHDNACFEGVKGRMVEPKDVIDMFNRVYTNTPENTGYFMFQNTVKGGDDFYNGDTTAISGLSIDGNKVIVELKEVSNTFLSKLLTVYGSIVPAESFTVEKWLPVGTGPFAYNSNGSNSELVVLDKNPDYWMKDSAGIQLPYLDKVTFKFYENELDKMNKFWTGQNAIVKSVPITKVSEVLNERIKDFEGKQAKYVLESVPQMSTTFLEFNMQSKIMQNVKVRKAINLAIDRKKLVEKVLKNQAFEIGKFGITPPLPKVYKDFDFDGVEEMGYTKNSELAKQMLAEAGYPDGKGFPTISAQFKLDNSMYLVMSEIQKQLLSVLNINLDIEQVELNQLIENNSLGKADIFENIWIGDFPSPESFLVNFYGKLVPEDKDAPSIINSGRYINPEFDELFEKGTTSKTSEEANEYFTQAEKVMLQDPALVVLFYGENLMLKQASIKNFYSNGLNYMDFTHVYLDETSVKEEITQEAH